MIWFLVDKQFNEVTSASAPPASDPVINREAAEESQGFLPDPFPQRPQNYNLGAAYAANSVAQVTFNAPTAKMSAPEREYLVSFFR